MKICVYCGSAAPSDEYVALADTLGERMATRGDTLVYGGGRVGLMGELARAVKAGGGQVIGVIPESLIQLELGYGDADELVVTKDLRERKGIMELRADAFVALPGGMGTIEEVMEIITLRQLRLTTKPLVLLNHAGFFDPLIALFAHLSERGFVKPNYPQFYHLAGTVDEVLAYLDSYTPTLPDSKF